jgi:hypothetical protein
VYQLRHGDRAQMSRGRQQLPVNMMIERFSAKSVQFKLVDQVLDRVRKFIFAIPDKLGEGCLRSGSGRRSEVIRKIEMNAVDFRQLLVRNSRQFGQRSVFIRHSFSQLLRTSIDFSGSNWKPILILTVP